MKRIGFDILLIHIIFNNNNIYEQCNKAYLATWPRSRNFK